MDLPTPHLALVGAGTNGPPAGKSSANENAYPRVLSLDAHETETGAIGAHDAFGDARVSLASLHPRPMRAACACLLRVA